MVSFLLQEGFLIVSTGNGVRGHRRSGGRKGVPVDKVNVQSGTELKIRSQCRWEGLSLWWHVEKLGNSVYPNNPSRSTNSAVTAEAHECACQMQMRFSVELPFLQARP